ncbi:DUF2207 domain-containing protein [Amycolatopsis minnesotensis]|uniref:DUF2207 domain-containing protein n=1 Tax=Amycolatopsis minnesotensis TaxID=337894 RepID=UPI0031D8625E
MFRNLGAAAAGVAAAAVTAVLVTSGTAGAAPPPPLGPAPGPSMPEVPGQDMSKIDKREGIGERIAPPGPAISVALKVQRDGALQVQEKVVVPGGQQLERQVPLRVPADDDHDRTYAVRDAKVAGNGTAQATADTFVIRLSGGESTVTYTVDGAVADLADGQQVRWQVASGWNADLGKVDASFIAPGGPATASECFAGALGSNQRCTLAEVDHTGVARVQQLVLKAGERMDVAVGLSPGTVPANAKFVAVSSVSAAFGFDTTGLVALGAAVLLLVAGLLLLWRLRRRDANALAGRAAPVEVLVRDGERVYFASPDGVLPGQVGTVVDGTVDVVDISATVVDLAVRNYLWIAELRGPNGFLDWQLARRNAPDEHLHAFERAVFDALLPEGAESVLLSEVRSGGTLVLDPVRDAMYDDVVARKWFTRRPDAAGRNKLTWAGIGMTALGAVATVVLAFTVGQALIGVAVALAGIGLTVGASKLPARSERGRSVAGQVPGLLGYLRAAKREDIPPADQEMVFSRSLPYAVVLAETDRWVQAFADLDPSSDGAPGVYWYGGLEGDSDLRRFGQHFPSFLTALDGLLAEAGHRRSVRPEPVPA